MPFALKLPPDVTDVRARIPAPYLRKLGYPLPAAGQPDPVESFLATAVGYISSTTGRKVDLTLEQEPTTSLFQEWLVGGAAGYGSEMALGLIAYRAVILRTVQEMTHEGAQYMTAVVGEDYLESLKAGSYAESRRDPNEPLRGRGSQLGEKLINPWNELSDLLWLLCTPSQFDYWMTRLGQPMPASMFVEQDFRDTWDMPGAVPGSLPGFGPPGMGGDYLGQGTGSGEW